MSVWVLTPRRQPALLPCASWHWRAIAEEADMLPGPIVVKVGGSLFSMPDLAQRLRRWLAQAGPRILLVPGGGAAADVVREFDKCHSLGEEASHWLALWSLRLNAELL